MKPTFTKVCDLMSENSAFVPVRPHFNLKFYWPRALSSNKFCTFVKFRPHTKAVPKFDTHLLQMK